MYHSFTFRCTVYSLACAESCECLICLFSPKFGSLSSVLLQWGATPLSRFSMDAVEVAWNSLRDSGFSKYDLVRSEFDSPLSLARLFDTKLERLSVVNGLHGDDYKTNSALGDAVKLFEWSEKFVELFSVLEREGRERAKRCRLLSPPRVDASYLHRAFGNGCQVAEQSV